MPHATDTAGAAVPHARLRADGVVRSSSDVTHVTFIIGCTACGKGALGRELARRIGGEIVSVDSMKVYRTGATGGLSASASSKPSSGR